MHLPPTFGISAPLQFLMKACCGAGTLVWASFRLATEVTPTNVDRPLCSLSQPPTAPFSTIRTRFLPRCVAPNTLATARKLWLLICLGITGNFCYGKPGKVNPGHFHKLSMLKCFILCAAKPSQAAECHPISYLKISCCIHDARCALGCVAVVLWRVRCCLPCGS